MKSARIYGLPRLVGFATLVICSSALYAQNGQVSTAQTQTAGYTAASFCNSSRAGYTSFTQCHTSTNDHMCAMAQAENQAQDQAPRFDAIKNESNPNKVIKLADDFVRNFPNSILLSYVYSFGANAYQQKGDLEKVVEYTDKSLRLKPNDLMSLILSVGVLPLPQYIHSHPADRDSILRQAQSEADLALQLIPQIPKQPKESDTDYQKRLAGVASGIHGALGMVHLELAGENPAGPDKAELAKAELEFTTAVSTTGHPDPRDYYRMGEAYGVEGKLDDAIQAFAKAGKLGQGTVIKTYANEQIAQLKKRKAQGWTASNTSVGSGN
ncbi:MAG: hypothetical protein ACLQVM_27595 [Terriglobia bacterium]